MYYVFVRETSPEITTQSMFLLCYVLLVDIIHSVLPAFKDKNLQCVSISTNNNLPRFSGRLF